MRFPLFPEEASTVARQVDQLYFALTGLSAVILLIVFVPMVYFLFKYRRNKRANRGPVHLSTTRIEVTWTVIPLLLGLGLFAWGAQIYFEMQRVPDAGRDVYVVGKQWMWRIQHSTGRQEINELHIPLGETILFTLASEDVIHSFYIPAFRIKQDVVPGRYLSQWCRATKPGKYRLFCAEFCGTEHSKMTGWVHVMEPAEYQKWLVQGGPPEPLAAVGERLYRETGCSGCHSGSSIVRAPPLEGLYGRPVPLESGEVVIADDKYIRDSILLPQLQITAGYEPVMPTFQSVLSEEQVLQLVVYIKSLADKRPSP